MRTKPALTAEDAQQIAAVAEAHAREHGWNVTIAVVDDGAHLLHLHRMDGAAPSTVEMAVQKARTSALGRRETRIYEDIVKQGRTSFLSAPLAAMIEGGVPIAADGGECVGAVGVSGAKSDQDAQIAREAIAKVVAG